MSEKPILFSGPMVQAILAGKKTQTRRVFKGEAYGDFDCMCKVSKGLPKNKLNRWGAMFKTTDMDLPVHFFTPSPYGFIGDHLWVRETWSEIQNKDGYRKLVYAASGKENMHIGYPIAWNWKPSIHMPRSASRILLNIKNVRVERLQNISFEDACSEGLYQEWDGSHTWYAPNKEASQDGMFRDPREAFSKLWDSINANRKDKNGILLPYSWKDNPWVWVTEFEKQ